MGKVQLEMTGDLERLSTFVMTALWDIQFQSVETNSWEHFQLADFIEVARSTSW